MEITTETVEPRQVQLTIVMPDAVLDAARREVVAAFSRENKIPGFRPGKAPRARVAALVGDAAIEEEALERASRTVVQQAVEQEGLRPSAPVSIEKASDEPLTLRALVPLAPEVDLGDYNALRVELPEPESVPDDAVDETLERWRNEMAVLEPAEGAAEAGDVVRLSLVGTLDDKIVFEEEALSLRLDSEQVADAGVPPEVVDELIGLAAGESHAFTLVYSEFWPQTELQGKTVSFQAEVDGVSRLTLPEMDDDLAQQLADVETLAELRETVRAQLEQRARMAGRDTQVEQVVDTMVERANFAYPPQLLEHEVADVIGDLRSRVERQGFRWEHWLEMQKENEDQILSDAEASARQRLERSLVMTAFVEREGISVSADEVQHEVEAFTQMLSAPARRGMPDDETLRRQMGSRLLSSRAIARLMAIVSGEAADAPPEASTEIEADPEDEHASDESQA